MLLPIDIVKAFFARVVVVIKQIKFPIRARLADSPDDVKLPLEPFGAVRIGFLLLQHLFPQPKIVHLHLISIEGVAFLRDPDTSDLSLLDCGYSPDNL